MRKIVDRPWGWFEVLKESDNYWVKQLVIHPGQETSLQYHKHRDEFWYVLSGSGIVTYQSCEEKVFPEDTFTINSFTIHRIKNTGRKKPLIIIEIASGKPREDDIVRLEDKYGRPTEEGDPDYR